MALGGLKQSKGATFVQGNLEITFDLGLQVTGNRVPEPEPNPEVELHIDIISSNTLVLVELRDLFVVEHQHLLPRENGAHGTGALLVLAEGVHVSYDIVIGEPGILVEC